MHITTPTDFFTSTKFAWRQRRRRRRPETPPMPSPGTSTGTCTTRPSRRPARGRGRRIPAGPSSSRPPRVVAARPRFVLQNFYKKLQNVLQNFANFLKITKTISGDRLAREDRLRISEILFSSGYKERGSGGNRDSTWLVFAGRGQTSLAESTKWKGSLPKVPSVL